MQTHNHGRTLRQTNMHVYTVLYIHAYMPAGKKHRHKQSSSTWMGPPANDIKTNIKKAEIEGTGEIKCSQKKEKGGQKCLLMTYLVQAVTHTVGCTGTTSSWQPVAKNKDAESCLARLAIFCRSVLKEAFIVTHICWAIDVVQEIPYGKRQPATSGRTHWETVLRLKISPSHLMLAPRTGKCVWHPLAIFLYLPVTHTAAAKAETARHAGWLWQAALNTLLMRWI